MNVMQLISHLQQYAMQKPENGDAEVIFRFEETGYPIAGALDVRGMGSVQPILLMMPDYAQRINMREFKLQ